MAMMIMVGLFITSIFLLFLWDHRKPRQADK